jgi:hypothetical protein
MYVCVWWELEHDAYFCFRLCNDQNKFGYSNFSQGEIDTLLFLRRHTIMRFVRFKYTFCTIGLFTHDVIGPHTCIRHFSGIRTMPVIAWRFGPTVVTDVST